MNRKREKNKRTKDTEKERKKARKKESQEGDWNLLRKRTVKRRAKSLGNPPAHMQINRTDNCHHFCMHAPFVAAALTSGARKGTKKRQIKRSREPLRDRSGTDLEPLWDACGSGRLLTQGNCDRFKILDTTLFVFVFAVNCQVGRCGRHGNKQETAAFDALPSSTERNARLFFVFIIFCLLSFCLD